MRVTVPPDSSSWGVNIGPKNHNNFTDTLFHFNPRRRFVAMNNRKADIWGQQVNSPNSEIIDGLDLADVTITRLFSSVFTSYCEAWIWCFRSYCSDLIKTCMALNHREGFAT